MESENQFRAYTGNDLLKIKTVFEAVTGLEVSNLISTVYVIENGVSISVGSTYCHSIKRFEIKSGN